MAILISVPSVKLVAIMMADLKNINSIH